MKPSMNALTRALRLYLECDRSAWPGNNPEAVEVAFGAIAGAALNSEVEALLNELGSLQPDWNGASLISATQWAQSEMLQRHPMLEPEAIAALGWAFSYWNK